MWNSGGENTVKREKTKGGEKKILTVWNFKTGSSKKIGKRESGPGGNVLWGCSGNRKKVIGRSEEMEGPVNQTINNASTRLIRLKKKGLPD